MPHSGAVAALSAAGQCILDILYPPRCVACHFAGAWLCDACALAFRAPAGLSCAQCGQPSAASPCATCVLHSPAFRELRAAAEFTGPVRQAVHALKYGNATVVAPALATFLASAYEQAGWHSDLLVPVPLHPARLRSRGYNQAGVLADALSKQIGVRVSHRALKRGRATADQIGLDADQRRTNVAGAFQIGDSAGLLGSSAVLIDDVATTGSTLDACAAALVRGGADRVTALVLGRRSLDARD